MVQLVGRYFKRLAAQAGHSNSSPTAEFGSGPKVVQLRGCGDGERRRIEGSSESLSSCSSLLSVLLFFNAPVGEFATVLNSARGVHLVTFRWFGGYFGSGLWISLHSLRSPKLDGPTPAPLPTCSFCFPFRSAEWVAAEHAPLVFPFLSFPFPIDQPIFRSSLRDGKHSWIRWPCRSPTTHQSNPTFPPSPKDFFITTAVGVVIIVVAGVQHKCRECLAKQSCASLKSCWKCGEAVR